MLNMAFFTRRKPPNQSTETDPLIPPTGDSTNHPQELPLHEPSSHNEPRKSVNISVYILAILTIIVLARCLTKNVTERIESHWHNVLARPPASLNSLVDLWLTDPIDQIKFSCKKPLGNEEEDMVQAQIKLAMKLNYTEAIYENSNLTYLDKKIWRAASESRGVVRLNNWLIKVSQSDSIADKDHIKLFRVRNIPDNMLEIAIAQGQVSHLTITALADQIIHDPQVYQTFLDYFLDETTLLPVLDIEINADLAWQPARWSWSKSWSWLIGNRKVQFSYIWDLNKIFTQDLANYQSSWRPTISWDNISLSSSGDWRLNIDAQWVNYPLPLNLPMSSLNWTVAVMGCKAPNSNRRPDLISVANIISDPILLTPYHYPILNLTAVIPTLDQSLMETCGSPKNSDNAHSPLDNLLAGFLAANASSQAYLQLSPQQDYVTSSAMVVLPSWIVDMVYPLIIPVTIPPLHNPEDENNGLLKQLVVSDVSLKSPKWAPSLSNAVGLTFSAHISAVVGLPYTNSTITSISETLIPTTSLETSTIPVKYRLTNKDIAVVAFRTTTALYFQQTHFANLRVSDWTACDSNLIDFDSYNMRSNAGDGKSNLVDSMWVDAILDNIPLDIVNQLVLSRLTRQLFMYGSATVGFEASVDLKLRLALVDNGSDDLDHHGVVLRQLPLSGVTELTSG